MCNIWNKFLILIAFRPNLNPEAVKLWPFQEEICRQQQQHKQQQGRHLTTGQYRNELHWQKYTTSETRSETIFLFFWSMGYWYRLLSIWPWPKSQTCLLSDVAALLRMAIIQISEGHADAGHKLNSAINIGGWKGRWKWQGRPWKRQKWWWRWFSPLIDIEMCFDIEKLTEIDCTEGGEHSLQGWNWQWRNCLQKWGQVGSEICRNIP